MNETQWRADAVRAFLADRGVAAVRLKARGCGQDMPLFDLRDPKENRLNRCIECI